MANATARLESTAPVRPGTPPPPTPKVTLEIAQGLTTEGKGQAAQELASIRIPLPVISSEQKAKAAALAEKAATADAKSDDPSFFRQFFTAVAECLETSILVENITVAVPTAINTALAVNQYDPVTRMNITAYSRTAILGTSYAGFALAAAVYKLRKHYSKEEANAIVKDILKHESLLASGFLFAFITACQIAARTPGGTDNTALYISLGVAIGSAIVECGIYHHTRKSPPTNKSKAVWFTLFVLSCGALVSQIGRAFWEYFPMGYDMNSQRDSAPVNYIAIATSATALIAGAGLWYKNKLTQHEKWVQRLAPLNGLFWDIGSIFESYGVGATIAGGLFITELGLQLFAPPIVKMISARQEEESQPTSLRTPFLTT